MSILLPNYRKATRRWLTLLVVAGFLLNIQSSFACEMMPDMGQNQMECCCGASHRMDDMESLDHDSSAMTMHHDMATGAEGSSHDQGPICNDPQMGCCQIEVSVGINDPPDDKAIGTASVLKSSPSKLVKQIDSHFSFALIYPINLDINLRNLAVVSYLPNSTLQQAGPPLYMTTQRYRI